MKCPECGVELTTLRCYSECVQECMVNARGVVSDFQPPEVLEGDAHYECPECCSEVMDVKSECSEGEQEMAKMTMTKVKNGSTRAKRSSGNVGSAIAKTRARRRSK